jgi:hypothetical protein
MPNDNKPKAPPKRGRRAKAVLAGTAGLLPLALALFGSSILQNRRGELSKNATTHGVEAVECDSAVEDSNSCHTDYPTGCSKSGRYDAYLNLLKNQVIRPASDNNVLLTQKDFKDLEKQIPDDLAKTNHEEFGEKLKQMGEGEIREVIGYLYYAKKTGAESSNCQLTEAEDVDYHIGIGFDDQLAGRLRNSRKLAPEDRKALTQTSIIVEMTPHYRAFFETNWTLEELKAVIGKKVKVIGQVMVDSEHRIPSQDCAFRDDAPSTCWRASAWELHPVTGFFVCGREDENCDADSNDWAELGKPDKLLSAAVGKKTTRARRE